MQKRKPEKNNRAVSADPAMPGRRKFLTVGLGGFFSSPVPDLLVELMTVSFCRLFAPFMSGLFYRHLASVLFFSLSHA